MEPILRFRNIRSITFYEPVTTKLESTNSNTHERNFLLREFLECTNTSSKIGPTYPSSNVHAPYAPSTALEGLHTKRWAAYIWKALTRHSGNPTAATKRRSLKFHRESPSRVDVSSSLYEFRVCVGCTSHICRVHEGIEGTKKKERKKIQSSDPCFLASNRVTGSVSKQWRTLIGPCTRASK